MQLSSNQNISGEEFAERVIAGLKKAGDDREISYDAEEFRLLFFEDGADCGILNLSNLFAEYANLDVEGQQTRISEIVRAALSHLKPIPEEFKDASYDLRPRLWARSTFELMRLRCRLEGTEDPRWPLEPIGDHLHLSLVFDLPESVRSLSSEELENWGISYWEAREVAMQNLAEEDLVMASLGDVLYASNTGDSYDATRLALTNLVEQLTVDGEPIAMVPNRDTLLVTGTDSEVGIKMMLELAAKELAENPRPLIATILIFQDGEWRDWELPKSHPSFEDYRRCVLGWRQFEYENQKKLLDAICENEMNEQFNANYTVICKDDQHLSYCVWGKGLISSLPKTDLVAFMDDAGGGVRAFAAWDVVEKACGEWMSVQDHYPPRYRVENFPPESVLDGLSDSI